MAQRDHDERSQGRFDWLLSKRHHSHRVLHAHRELHASGLLSEVLRARTDCDQELSAFPLGVVRDVQAHLQSNGECSRRKNDLPFTAPKTEDEVLPAPFGGTATSTPPCASSPSAAPAAPPRRFRAARVAPGSQPPNHSNSTVSAVDCVQKKFPVLPS